MEWFINLEPTLKMYWIVALAASLAFVVQTIMTFIGAEASDGLNADFHGDFHADGPFQLFSIRNFVNFFLGFGWGGICFYNSVQSAIWLSVIAVIIGLVFVALFFFLMVQITKLAKDNTFKISETINQNADVYLVIPGEKKGKGKIQISVRGAFHELDAMTEGERIPTGSKVKVESLIDSQTVLVSKI